MPAGTLEQLEDPLPLGAVVVTLLCADYHTLKLRFGTIFNFKRKYLFVKIF
jgi:hypothetical protein